MNIPLPVERFFAYVIAIETERALRDFAENGRQDATPPSIHFHRGFDPAVELSIVIPAWNPQEAQFSRCLRSLKKAELEGIAHEIVVSDDASAGHLAKACFDRCKLPHAHFIRQESNLGGFGNFNWCIGAARGKWIHLLHQDDWVEPAFYRELLRGAAADSVAELRYCRTKLFYESAGETRLMFDEAPTAGVLADFFQRQCVSQRIQIAGAVMARDALALLGGYDPRLGTGSDWEFWARWARSCKVFYNPRTLATYSLHDASWSSREAGGLKDAKSLADNRKVLQRILGHASASERRQVAVGFLTNMLSRLLGMAARNRKQNATQLNHAAAEALLTGCKDAGILPDIERLLATAA